MFGLLKLIIYLISMGVVASETKLNRTGVYFSPPPPQLTYDSGKPKDENGKWRKLSNGETVPAGSSVKINLQTGEKLIKVNDDDNSKSGKKIMKMEGYVTWNDVKYGLKQIKNMTSAKGKNSKVQSNRTDYRDMNIVLQELKFDFHSTTTETDILKQFLANYTKGSLSDKMEILEEIEFLVHKYSFGKAFVRLGGLEIFKKDVQETTNFTHKAMIAMTLGSAIQGNPVVKGAVITHNIMPIFIDFLKSEVNILQLRSAFALSALLRNCKQAQAEFFALEGYSVFADVLNGKYSSSSKLLQKIVILMADLLYENDPSEYTIDEIHELGLSVYNLEYQRHILHTIILEYKMCSSFCSLLSSDNDVIVGNVIKILDKLKQVCTKELLEVYPQINYLAVTYSHRFSPEHEEDFDDWDADNTKTYVRLNTMIYFLQKFLKDEL